MTQQRRTNCPTKQARNGLDGDACWSAVLARDATSDGTFVYSVASTGVYCRPSCSARRPLRKNVRFHASCAEAEAEGFRPCKRCRPREPSGECRQTELIAAACRRLETADDVPSLGQLADAAGLSPYHFHRVFKAATGVTPRAYAMAHRNKRVRDGLNEARTVTAAIHEAGFNSAGRFYATANAVLGMTPTAFRAGGASTTIRFAVGPCSLGHVLVAASDKGIVAILLGDEPEPLIRDLEARFPSATLVGADRAFERLAGRAIASVETPGKALDLPLDIRGTAFQHRVWQALTEIPPGTTQTYAEIAERIGAPTAVRAVARACAANPIAVVVPCHRVVRTGGALSGYRWGIARKRALLDKEARPRRK